MDSVGMHPNTKHGHATGGRLTAEYRAWQCMITRCENSNSINYAEYGGSGITVCERWRNSFAAFLEDMGLKPGPEYTLDRYPNPAGNYEPGNCRWATPKQQARNRRTNLLLTYNGQTKTLAEWAERTGFRGGTIKRRLERGWSVRDAIETPLQACNFQAAK